MVERGRWVLTDDSCLQVQRQYDITNNSIWQMAEIRKVQDLYCVVHDVYDLSTYNKSDIKDTLATYGYENVNELSDNPDIQNALIAEMLFECDDNSFPLYFNDWKDAVSQIERITHMDLTTYKNNCKGA